jgi:hypothetical protein
VLQAACAGSSHGSHSSSDAVIRMLSCSKIPIRQWDAETLLGVSSSCIAGTATTTSSSDSHDALALTVVPWLVNLGRCCNGYALIQQQSTAGTAAFTRSAAAERSIQQNMESMAQALQEVAAVLPSWLQSSTVAAQLAAAGYSTQRVIELLQSIGPAGQHAAHADAAQAEAAAAVPPELLQRLGLALCNLPVGIACNNLRCTSLAGLSEQQSVVRRLCAGCLVARYCCRACQVAAWKQHKPACKAVASAQAAKAAEQAA